MDTPGLPTSHAVNVQTLSRLFAQRTNSYKFLFFLALLENCERTVFRSLEFQLDDILVDMLVLAWYPHVYFKLSFGKTDQLARELERMPVDSVGGKFAPTDKDAVRSQLKLSKEAYDLVRYVPFRLIRPFFPDIGSPADHLVNGLVKEAAEKYFVDGRPLYKISGNESTLTLHPQWAEYLKANYAIVRGWACWHYLQYMQKNNPMVPNLASKLFPLAERESLKKQTEYWNTVCERSELRCIYSGTKMEPGTFALDHFLPWSFVVHNELWNLIPVDPAANSAKSDRLPDDRYVEPFLSAQQAALIVTRCEMAAKTWTDSTAVYPLRLQLKEADWLESPNFRDCYRQVLSNQIQLASINGFEPGWKLDVRN